MAKPFSAKDIVVKPISSKDANACIKRLHYSGKVVNNSQLHFGVFLDGKLQGAMQFGPPTFREKMVTLVAGTQWNDFLELNRMAFGPLLPKNSESRAIGVALRMIRKTYPNMEWIISFADGTQCGDGTIYRASGFVLTGIKKNASMVRMPSGEVMSTVTLTKGKHILQNGGGAKIPEGAVALDGFQLRYIYFLKPDARKRLTVPEIPFSRIDEVGAGMYRGQKRAVSKADVASGFQPEEGGLIPTTALQPSPAEETITDNTEEQNSTSHAVREE